MEVDNNKNFILFYFYETEQIVLEKNIPSRMKTSDIRKEPKLNYSYQIIPK